MMSSTELDVTQLDDHASAATLPQGEVCMALAFVPSGDTYALQTPRGLVQIAATGNIAVIAGDTQNPTTVLVQNGAAQITGTNLSLQVGAGQMASISGSEPFQGSVGPAPGPDPCLQQLLAPPPPVETQATSRHPRPRPPQWRATGGAGDDGLPGTAAIRSWQSNPQYGPVWYPQRRSDWAPYQEALGLRRALGLDLDERRTVGLRAVPLRPLGRYRRPLGLGARRPWRRRGVRAPVYAPALVAFFGMGAAVVAGAAVGAAIGYAFSGGNVGAGCRSAGTSRYYPWYRVNNGYLDG